MLTKCSLRNCADALVLERLAFHHVAPVAGRIADAQEDRLVFRARFCKRLVAPREPVHGIVRVLEQIRRFLARQAVGMLWHPSWTRWRHSRWNANDCAAVEQLIVETGSSLIPAATFRPRALTLASCCRESRGSPNPVLLFCGAQLLCFGVGILAAALLHKAGVRGFKHAGRFRKHPARDVEFSRRDVGSDSGFSAAASNPLARRFRIAAEWISSAPWPGRLAASDCRPAGGAAR